MLWIFVWLLWTGEMGMSRHPSQELCEAARDEFLLKSLTHPDLPIGGQVHASPCVALEEA